MKQYKIFKNKRGFEYTAFIYIWKQTTTGRFYIGSHIGSVDDGYTGSGTHFVNAYKQDKSCFRRKILSYVLATDITPVLTAEESWLRLMKDDEMFGKKYFNRTKTAHGLHPLSPESIEKMASKLRGRKISEAHKLAISRAGMGNKHNLGRPTSQKQKDAVRLANKNRVFTQEIRDKIAKTLTGVPHTPERIAKMTKAKLELDLTWYNNSVIDKLFKTGEEQEGFTLGRIYKINYNDGLVTKKFIPGQEPTGFEPGRLMRPKGLIYNNGIVSKRFTEKPGSPWIKGRIANNKVWFNNGSICKAFVVGSEPEGWIKGGLPRK